MTKKTLSLMAGLLLLGAAVSPAKADLWSFSYVDTVNALTAFGSGTFETGATGSPYTITGVTGNANGSAITGLSGYASSDNLLFVPGFPADFGGISFSTSAGIDWNLSSLNGGSALRSDTDPVGFGTFATPITMQVAAVPEPEIYAMMAAGLGLMGFVARRRKAQAAAA